MVTFDIDKYLSGHVFAFLFIFSRIGSVFVIMPGLAESYVPVRTRLLFALSVSFLLLEPLLPKIPPPPGAVPDMVALLTYEIAIGLLFGTLLRLLVSVLEAAGTVIGLQTGLSNATILNPALASQSPLPSALLTVVGITLIFSSGLDHLIFRSLLSLYEVFPPGGELMPGDMTQIIIHIANQSFVLGVELAMPFFVIGLLLYVALGLIQKLLPQVQLFLVAMPLQIWGGLTLTGLTIAGIMTIWLHYFDNAVTTFLSH